jgi:hypothetical protein
LALRPSESLGLPDYGRPFFSVHCFPSSFLNFISCKSFSKSSISI